MALHVMFFNDPNTIPSQMLLMNQQCKATFILSILPIGVELLIFHILLRVVCNPSTYAIHTRKNNHYAITLSLAHALVYARMRNLQMNISELLIHCCRT